MYIYIFNIKLASKINDKSNIYEIYEIYEKN